MKKKPESTTKRVDRRAMPAATPSAPPKLSRRGKPILYALCGMPDEWARRV
jgi:hypothetical protein